MIPACDFDAAALEIGANLNQAACSTSSAGLIAYPTYLPWVLGIIFALFSLYVLWSVIDAKRSKPRLLFIRWVLSGLAWAASLFTADSARSWLEREIVPVIAEATRDLPPLGIFPFGLLMIVVGAVLYMLVPAAWADLLGRIGRNTDSRLREPKASATPAATTVASNDLPRWGER